MTLAAAMAAATELLPPPFPAAPDAPGRTAGGAPRRRRHPASRRCRALPAWALSAGALPPAGASPLPQPLLASRSPAGRKGSVSAERLPPGGRPESGAPSVGGSLPAPPVSASGSDGWAPEGGPGARWLSSRGARSLPRRPATGPTRTRAGAQAADPAASGESAPPPAPRAPQPSGGAAAEQGAPPSAQRAPLPPRPSDSLGGTSALPLATQLPHGRFGQRARQRHASASSGGRALAAAQAAELWPPPIAAGWGGGIARPPSAAAADPSRASPPGSPGAAQKGLFRSSGKAFGSSLTLRRPLAARRRKEKQQWSASAVGQMALAAAQTLTAAPPTPPPQQPPQVGQQPQLQRPATQGGNADSGSGCAAAPTLGRRPQSAVLPPPLASPSKAGKPPNTPPRGPTRWAPRPAASGVQPPLPPRPNQPPPAPAPGAAAALPPAAYTREYYFLHVRIVHSIEAIHQWVFDVRVSDATDPSSARSCTFPGLRVSPTLHVVFAEPNECVLSPVDELPWVNRPEDLWGRSLRVEVIGVRPYRTTVVDTTVHYGDEEDASAAPAGEHGAEEAGEAQDRAGAAQASLGQGEGPQNTAEDEAEPSLQRPSGGPRAPPSCSSPQRQPPATTSEAHDAAGNSADTPAFVPVPCAWENGRPNTAPAPLRQQRQLQQRLW
eukprot:TRINITY_DN15586_c0_g1_i2.p1 TRINITY_DN15586_c0_g1~~TRINITY_DN15586_c0_g1_i2.p1  ORF type:complete len:666 (+),score=99.32 TRINITY_DN15586_c0_g1_i2:63-2060(+)